MSNELILSRLDAFDFAINSPKSEALTILFAYGVAYGAADYHTIATRAYKAFNTTDLSMKQWYARGFFIQDIDIEIPYVCHKLCEIVGMFDIEVLNLSRIVASRKNNHNLDTFMNSLQLYYNVASQYVEGRAFQLKSGLFISRFENGQSGTATILLRIIATGFREHTGNRMGLIDYGDVMGLIRDLGQYHINVRYEDAVVLSFFDYDKSNPIDLLYHFCRLRIWDPRK